MSRGIAGAAAATALALAMLPMGEFNIVLGSASFAAGRLNREEMALLGGQHGGHDFVRGTLGSRGAQG